MLQHPGWAYPGSAGTGSADADAEYTSGGLQVVTAGGRVLLAGMYCDASGHNRVDLRDTATGEIIDAYGHYKEWWNEPSRHFISFRRGGEPFTGYARPRWGYVVERVTAKGYAPSGHDPSENEVASAVVPGEAGGRPAIVVGSSAGAVIRDWADADLVLGSWTVPPGWQYPDLVAAGGRVYAWLGWDVPADTPSGERWRVAAAHGSQLWDVIADVPVGPPLLVRGYQWGPWELAGRPVLLFKVDWRDFQLWDIGRREPLGPGLGDLELANPSAGLMHGRPVLAGTVGTSLAAWDVGTGRLLGELSLPDQPIATTIGAGAPGATAWAITRSGHIGRLTIPLARIHPSARRA